MLFRPGNIFATLFIDKTLYVPGETIYVSATIENNSNSGIESSTIKLVQVIQNTLSIHYNISMCNA